MARPSKYTLARKLLENGYFSQYGENATKLANETTWENLFTYYKEMKDYEKCICLVNDFLPCVDNWATCDQMSPKVFKKHKTKLLASKQPHKKKMMSLLMTAMQSAYSWVRAYR